METKLSGQDLLNMMTPDRSELLNSRAIKEAGYKAMSMGTTAADSFESLSKEEQKKLLDSCYKEKLDFTLFITQDTRKMVSGVNVAVEIAKEPNTAAKKEATDSFFSSLLKIIKTMAWNLFSGAKSSVHSVMELLGNSIAWVILWCHRVRQWRTTVDVRHVQGDGYALYVSECLVVQSTVDV